MSRYEGQAEAFRILFEEKRELISNDEKFLRPYRAFAAAYEKLKFDDFINNQHNRAIQWITTKTTNETDSTFQTLSQKEKEKILNELSKFLTSWEIPVPDGRGDTLEKVFRCVMKRRFRLKEEDSTNWFLSSSLVLAFPEEDALIQTQYDKLISEKKQWFLFRGEMQKTRDGDPSGPLRRLYDCSAMNDSRGKDDSCQESRFARCPRRRMFMRLLEATFPSYRLAGVVVARFRPCNSLDHWVERITDSEECAKLARSWMQCARDVKTAMEIIVEREGGENLTTNVHAESVTDEDFNNAWDAIKRFIAKESGDVPDLVSHLSTLIRKLCDHWDEIVAQDFGHNLDVIFPYDTSRHSILAFGNALTLMTAKSMHLAMTHDDFPEPFLAHLLERLNSNYDVFFKEVHEENKEKRKEVYKEEKRAYNEGEYERETIKEICLRLKPLRYELFDPSGIFHSEGIGYRKFTTKTDCTNFLGYIEDPTSESDVLYNKYRHNNQRPERSLHERILATETPRFSRAWLGIIGMSEDDDSIIRNVRVGYATMGLTLTKVIHFNCASPLSVRKRHKESFPDIDVHFERSFPRQDELLRYVSARDAHVVVDHDGVVKEASRNNSPENHDLRELRFDELDPRNLSGLLMFSDKTIATIPEITPAVVHSNGSLRIGELGFELDQVPERLFAYHRGFVVTVDGPNLVVWDDRLNVKKTKAIQSQVSCLAMCQDLDRVAIGYDKYVMILNLDLDFEYRLQCDSGVSAMAWSGKDLVTGDKKGIVTVWRGDRRHASMQCSSKVTAIACSSDGRYIATGNEKLLRIWDAHAHVEAVPEIKMVSRIKALAWYSEPRTVVASFGTTKATEVGLNLSVGYNSSFLRSLNFYVPS